MIREMGVKYEQACVAVVMSKRLRSVNTLDVRWQTAGDVAGCRLRCLLSQISMRQTSEAQTAVAGGPTLAWLVPLWCQVKLFEKTIRHVVFLMALHFSTASKLLCKTTV